MFEKRPSTIRYFIPLFFFLFGAGLVHNFGSDPAAWVLASGCWVIGFYIGAEYAIVEIIRGLREGEEEEVEKKTVMETTTITRNEPQLDPRWRTWAAAVCEGAPLAQRKWTGADRPFSRREYEEAIFALLDAGVLRQVTGKNNKSGVRPNGAGGWETLKRAALGERVLPLPHLNTSSED